MNRKLTLLLLVTLTLLALSACYGGVYVRVPPPPARYGVVGYAPGPGFVWADGYWDWRGGNWFWVGGTWMRPPRPGVVWVAPRWVPYGHRYRFVRGYWRR
ncbi:MAG: hypothetical protein ABSF54_27460 [Bryobacteraceae bacterium]|jgi:YXWGXW repeat-containing protein